MSIEDIPIYIINLKKEKERLNLVKKELKKIANFNNINVFEAIDSKKSEEIAHEYIDYAAYENIVYKLSSTKILPTWSSVGCAISHYQCWDLIKKQYESNKSKFNFGIIVEDDIKIENIKKALFKIYKIFNTFKRLKYDNLMVLFNCFKNPNLNTDNDLEYNDNTNNNYTVHFLEDIEKINNEFIGTHFYFINIEFIKILQKYILPIKFQLIFKLEDLLIEILTK